MKRTLLTILTVLLILILAIGLFACKEHPTDTSETTDELALKTVNVVIPNGENNQKIATDLVALLTEAGLEEAEIRAVLTALGGDDAVKYEYALIDLSAGQLRAEHTDSYRSALQAIAGAVSPELAGGVYYTAAKRERAELPYTLEDCKKLSSLILSETSAFDLDLLDGLSEAQSLSMNEKEATTALVSLAASLRQAIGVSQGAKDYLYSLAASRIGQLQADEGASEEVETSIGQLQDFLRSLIAQLRDRYDLALTYAAEYLSTADARILIGLTYERRESVVYYGYLYSDWSKTPISEEDYLARRGGYDEYLEVQTTLKGFTRDGSFYVVSDEDAAIAERVYRLNLAYRAYSALKDGMKSAFRAALPDLFEILTQNQGIVADLLNREIIEDSGAPAASFDELLSALPAIADYDVTDGITETERAAARSTLAVFERYLHGYLPRIY